MKIKLLFCALVLFLLPGGLCDDADVWMEPVIRTSLSLRTNPCDVKYNNSEIIEINCYNKGLTSIPESIGSLTTLTRLWSWKLKKKYVYTIIVHYDRNLEKNSLTRIPDSIYSLTSLKKLWLWLLYIYIYIYNIQ